MYGTVLGLINTRRSKSGDAVTRGLLCGESMPLKIRVAAASMRWKNNRYKGLDVERTRGDSEIAPKRAALSPPGVLTVSLRGIVPGTMGE